MRKKISIGAIMISALVSASSHASPPGNPLPFSPLVDANTVHGVPYRWSENPFINTTQSTVHVVSLAGLQDGYLLDCNNGNYVILKAIARHTIHSWNGQVVFRQCNGLGTSATRASDGTFWLVSANLGANFYLNNNIGKLLRNGYIRQIVEVPGWNRNLQSLNSQSIVAWHLARL